MYGFIEKESDGKDIFVHYSSIDAEGYKTLKTGQEVTFEIGEGPKGPQAEKVQSTETTNESKPDTTEVPKEEATPEKTEE